MELQCKSREQLQQLAWLRVRWMGMHTQIKAAVIGGGACKRFDGGGPGGGLVGKAVVQVAAGGRRPRWRLLVLSRSRRRRKDRAERRDRGGRKEGSFPYPALADGVHLKPAQSCAAASGPNRRRARPRPPRPDAIPNSGARRVCERERACAWKVVVRIAHFVPAAGGGGPSGLLPEAVTSLECCLCRAG
jgi:hypothetical protein